MPKKYQPDYPYLRQVPIHRVHMFTFFQFACLVMLWVVKDIKSTSIFFPIMVISHFLSLPTFLCNSLSFFSTYTFLGTCKIKWCCHDFWWNLVTFEFGIWQRGSSGRTRGPGNAPGRTWVLDLVRLGYIRLSHVRYAIILLVSLISFRLSCEYKNFSILLHFHTDTLTRRHTDTQTHRHTNTQTHRHTD